MDFLSAKQKRQLTPEARERQRLGQYKGLLRAVAKRKADNSANYATNFDRGQTASDFERRRVAQTSSRGDYGGLLHTCKHGWRIRRFVMHAPPGPLSLAIRFLSKPIMIGRKLSNEFSAKNRVPSDFLEFAVIDCPRLLHVGSRLALLAELKV
ncbi:MAG TPA: hypothetical protein VMT20_17550 [Terriglobia bacterium]|nr:hypothetical protein [Terriglobia bacterium]